MTLGEMLEVSSTRKWTTTERSWNQVLGSCSYLLLPLTEDDARY